MASRHRGPGDYRQSVGGPRRRRQSTNPSPLTQQQSPPYRPGQPPPRKRHRVFLWVFLGIQVGFLAWVIYTGVTLPQSGPNDGFALQMGLWVLTDLITGTIYGIRQARRSS